MIRGYSPNIQVFAPFRNSNQISPHYIVRDGFDYSLGSNCCWRGALSCCDESVGGWKLRVQQLIMNVDVQLASRSIAAVSPTWPYSPEYAPIIDIMMKCPTASTIMDVSPQLRLCSAVCSFNQITGRCVQKPSRDKEPESKEGQQRISYFQSEPQERRPELGSLLLVMASIPFAFWCGNKGVVSGEAACVGAGGLFWPGAWL